MEKKPVFEIKGIDNDVHIKIFFNGEVEGLDMDGTYIINRTPIVVDRLLGKLKE